MERNIYKIGKELFITSDDEIKEDWLYRDVFPCVIKAEKGWNNKLNLGYKKIILTTDQDLIKDGVQEIDDEFLEWFVKNPSCEEVEVGYGWIRLTETDNEGYWVSIPDKQFEMQQEEPKQETLEEATERYFNEIRLNISFEKAVQFGANWQAEQNKNKFSEEDMLGFAWFLVKNIGQYSCDEIAHFEGKYLEQFKNK